MTVQKGGSPTSGDGIVYPLRISGERITASGILFCTKDSMASLGGRWAGICASTFDDSSAFSSLTTTKFIGRQYSQGLFAMGCLAALANVSILRRSTVNTNHPSNSWRNRMTHEGRKPFTPRGKSAPPGIEQGKSGTKNNLRRSMRPGRLASQ